MDERQTVCGGLLRVFRPFFSWGKFDQWHKTSKQNQPSRIVYTISLSSLSLSISTTEAKSSGPDLAGVLPSYSWRRGERRDRICTVMEGGNSTLSSPLSFGTLSLSISTTEAKSSGPDLTSVLPSLAGWEAEQEAGFGQWRKVWAGVVVRRVPGFSARYIFRGVLHSAPHRFYTHYTDFLIHRILPTFYINSNAQWRKLGRVCECHTGWFYGFRSCELLKLLSGILYKPSSICHNSNHLARSARLPMFVNIQKISFLLVWFSFS